MPYAATPHPNDRAGQHRSAVACVLAAVGLSALAVAQGPATSSAANAKQPGMSAMVLDNQLQPRLQRAVGFDEFNVTFLDDTGKKTTTPVTSMVGLIATPDSTSPTQGIGAVSPRAPMGINTIRRRLESQKAGALETTDGQRFPGSPALSAGQKDAVVWSHPRFGDITVSLDGVSSMARPTEDAATSSVALTNRDQPPREDELILANGDRITGLVVDLGDPVRIETDDQVVEMPADRVAGALLSNPRVPRGGVMVWLDDGTIAAIRAMSSRGEDRVLITLPEGQVAEYELDALRGIAFNASRLIPLSSLTPTEQTPIGERLHTLPVTRVHHPNDLGVGSAVTFGAWDLELPGPMRVTYQIPEGVQRLALTAALADDTAPWGDCELVIADETRELVRVHLSQSQPASPVNIPVTPGVMIITLEPGAYGPIKDHVILRRAMLLVN